MIPCCLQEDRAGRAYIFPDYKNWSYDFVEAGEMLDGGNRSTTVSLRHAGTRHRNSHRWKGS